MTQNRRGCEQHPQHRGGRGWSRSHIPQGISSCPPPPPPPGGPRRKTCFFLPGSPGSCHRRGSLPAGPKRGPVSHFLILSHSRSAPAVHHVHLYVATRPGEAHFRTSSHLRATGPTAGRFGDAGDHLGAKLMRIPASHNSDWFHECPVVYIPHSLARSLLSLTYDPSGFDIRTTHNIPLQQSSRFQMRIRA